MRSWPSLRPPRSSCLGATLTMAKITRWASSERHLGHGGQLSYNSRLEAILAIVKTSLVFLHGNDRGNGQDYLARLVMEASWPSPKAPLQLIVEGNLSHCWDLPSLHAQEQPRQWLRPPYETNWGGNLAITKSSPRVQGCRWSWPKPPKHFD